jgi:O-antigen/teichoic acid export membrane protein
MNADTIGVQAAFRNVVTGTATRYVLLAINIAMGVFLMPFTLRHLGTSEYGLWMLVASMTYYFQLLDLGYGTGVVRHIAEADARGDIDRANAIMSTFVVVYSVLGGIAAAGLVAMIAGVVPRFPNLQPDQVRRAQIVLALIGLRIVVGFPMTIFGAATTARQRFALNNTVAILGTLLNGAATYLVLTAGHGLVPLVGATTAISLCSYGAYVWTAHRAFPELDIRLSSFSRALVRDVTTYSAYLFLIDLAVQIGFNLDNVIIGAVLGTSAIAIYTVAQRLGDIQRQLCSQFNGLLFPVMVRLDARGDRALLQHVLVDGTRIALTLVVGVTVCLVGLGRPLVFNWLGAGFEGSILPLYVIAFIGVVIVGQGPLGSVLLATGRHRLVAMTSLAEAAANLAISLVLVRRIGIAGVAIGSAVPVFVANAFVLVPTACRQVGVPLDDFIRAVIVPPLVGAIPATMMVLAFRLFLPPASLPATIAEGAIAGGVYVAAVLAIGLDESVRRRYLHHVRDLLNAITTAKSASAKAAA